MPESRRTVLEVVHVDEQTRFTLVQLSEACRADTALLVDLVDEGVLEPIGEGPDGWVFGGDALGRALTALRIGRDLGLDATAMALVLDLLDEIRVLKARLRHAGVR